MSQRKYARIPGPIGNRNHPSNPSWQARQARRNRKLLVEVTLEILGVIAFVYLMMLAVGWAS